MRERVEKHLLSWAVVEKFIQGHRKMESPGPDILRLRHPLNRMSGFGWRHNWSCPHREGSHGHGRG